MDKDLVKSIVPPAISAGSNLIGAGLQQLFYRRNADYNQKLQQENLKYQWENAIPETVNSMRAAGLNVGLAYSNGGPSVSSSMGAGSVPIPSNPLTGVGELLNQARLISSQTFKNNAEGAEANVRALLTEKKTATEELEQAKIRLNNAKSEFERKEIQKEIELKQKQIEKIDNDIMNNNRLTESEVNLNTAKANESNAYATTENKLRGDKQANLQAGTKEYNASANLHNAQASKVRFEDDYQREYGRTMSNGLSNLIDRVCDWVAGTPTEQKNVIQDKVGELGLAGYVKRGFNNFLEDLKKCAVYVDDQHLFEYAKVCWDFIKQLQFGQTQR